MRRTTNYDIEKNLVCWHCTHANIELAKIFYKSQSPNRPLCAMISLSKFCYFKDNIYYDIPDPSEPIGEHGCIFDELGYDIRGEKHD